MTYEFECSNCKTHEDLEMSIAEYDKNKNNILCKKCNGKMNRFFTPIGLTEYKCMGFYDTDNRGIRGR